MAWGTQAFQRFRAEFRVLRELGQGSEFSGMQVFNGSLRRMPPLAGPSLSDHARDRRGSLPGSGLLLRPKP